MQEVAPRRRPGKAPSRGGAASEASMDEDAPAAPDWRPPRWVNRVPTPQELLELSHRVYKHSRRLYSEADAQGLRVYHDERLDGTDVRIMMLVPSWFPRPHVSFDTVLPRLSGDTVSVAIVVRGTVRDLVGNTIANLQLLFNKLIDDQYLPEAATDSAKVVQGWLLELLARHPELRLPGARADAAYGGPEWLPDDRAGDPACPSVSGMRRLRLDVSITGHSLGGLIAEAATVESVRFAEAHGMRWRCVSFESPGLPQHYMRAAMRLRPEPGAWDDTIKGYLAAPNPINMLYPHLGTVIHVLTQWEQTWSHVAKCVSADALRIAGWVAVASFTGAALQHVTGGRGRRDEEERRSATPPRVQPVIASALEVAPARGGRMLVSVPAAAADAAAAALSRQQCLAAAGPVAFTTGGSVIGGGTSSGAAAAGGAAAADAIAGGIAALATSVAGAAAAAVQNAATAVATSGPSVGNTVAAAASGAAQHALRQVGVGLPLGTIAAWLLAGSGPLGLAKCLAGVLGVEVEELVSQHGLGAMRPCFDSNTGELHERFARRMKSWPHLGDRGEVVLKAVQQVARWTLPSFLCHDNMGVWTMLSRTAMVEARCSRLAGYEPCESPTDVSFDRIYDIAPEELVPAAAQEAEGHPVRVLEGAPQLALPAPAGDGAGGAYLDQVLAAARNATAAPAAPELERVAVPVVLPLQLPLPSEQLMAAQDLGLEGVQVLGRPAAALSGTSSPRLGSPRLQSPASPAPGSARAAAAAAAATRAAAAAERAREAASAAAALAEAEGAVKLALSAGAVGDAGTPGVRARAVAIDEAERRRAALAAVTAALAARPPPGSDAGADGGEAAPMEVETFDSGRLDGLVAEPPSDGGSGHGGSDSEDEGEWEVVPQQVRRFRRPLAGEEAEDKEAGAVAGGQAAPAAFADGRMEVDAAGATSAARGARRRRPREAAEGEPEAVVGAEEARAYALA